MKMLVQAEAGWKVWGSRPSSLSDIAAGAKVEFVAQVEPSRDDNKFGFFKRPTQAVVLEEAA